MNRNSQNIEFNTLSVRGPNCWLQTIVKERVTRKVFWNIDLTGRSLSACFGAGWQNDLRCECARVHCALFMAWVKVIGHMEGEPGCGKIRPRSAPDNWKWGSFALYATGLGGEVEIDSQWTARREHPGTLRTSKAHPPAQNAGRVGQPYFGNHPLTTSLG